VNSEEEKPGSESIRLLRSIDRRLALLTGEEEWRLRSRLRADLLRTAARVAMFDAIDGRRGSPDLAKAAGVSDRAAQLFVKELLEMGLVDSVPGVAGRGVIVARNEHGIVRWYLDRAREDAEASR
jgi:hypothetical protein